MAQLVARLLWEQNAAGSSPVTPTKIAVLTAVEAAGESLRLLHTREKNIAHYKTKKEIDMSEIYDAEIIDLASSKIQDVSPYDNTYPIVLLSNGLKAKLNEAQIVAKDIYKAVIKQAPALAQIRQATQKGFRLVVDAGDDMLKAIESGAVKLSVEKSGKMMAQIRDANGRYGEKLPIRKEYFKKGIDSAQMANALQMQALQEQLSQITDQIQVINHSVVRVLEGQQNDRIAQYYSGLALYAESRLVTDSAMQKALVAQSLKALTEATFELTLTMQSDIKHLANRDGKHVKGKRIEYIDEHMQSVNQCFAFIHQAALLRAGIYCNEGELSAMTAVLDEYSRFIETTVGENATLLAQCDISDDGTTEGIWNSRAQLKLDVSEFAKQLNNPKKTIYLGIPTEVNNG